MRLTKSSVAKLALPAGKAEALLFDQDLPGFGIRIRSGGKKTWIAQFRVGAKQKRLSLGTPQSIDADEARRHARSALARVALGEDPALAKAEKVQAQAITIRTTLPGFLAFAEARQRPSTFGTCSTRCGTLAPA